MGISVTATAAFQAIRKLLDASESPFEQVDIREYLNGASTVWYRRRGSSERPDFTLELGLVSQPRVNFSKPADTDLRTEVQKLLGILYLADN